MTLLNVFDEWIQVKAEGRDTKKWCKRRGLEQQRLYEMVKLKNQFFQILKVRSCVARFYRSHFAGKVTIVKWSGVYKLEYSPPRGGGE